MRDRHSEGGSVLALMPAAVLVVLVLAAIAVDFALAFLGERQLADATAAAANDVAGQAVDEEAFRTSGRVVLDPAAAQRVAGAVFERERLGHLRELDWEVDVVGPDRVVVRATARVRTVFARAVPGGPETMAVDAETEAVAIVR